MTSCATCDAARDGNCYVAADRQPTVTHRQADGVEIVQIEIAEAGTLTPQHSHAYEHMTVLARGSVRVFRDGALVQKYVAPDAITIPAQTKHLFETLTPDVLLLCIHNTARTGMIEVAAEHQIVGGA